MGHPWGLSHKCHSRNSAGRAQDRGAHSISIWPTLRWALVLALHRVASGVSVLDVDPLLYYTLGPSVLCAYIVHIVGASAHESWVQSGTAC